MCASQICFPTLSALFCHGFKSVWRSAFSCEVLASSPNRSESKQISASSPLRILNSQAQTRSYTLSPLVHLGTVNFIAVWVFYDTHTHKKKELKIHQAPGFALTVSAIVVMIMEFRTSD